MLIYIQWARGTPQDWQAYSLVTDSDIRNLPRRPEPLEGEDGIAMLDVGGGFGIQPALDVTHPDADDEGWIYDVSIQGQSLSGCSGLHFDMDGGALVVTRWHDSDVWAANVDRFAQRWRYQLPVGSQGKMYPRITLEEVWCEGAVRTARYVARPGDAIVSPWVDFSMPGPANKRLYGIWQTEANWRAQEAAKMHGADFRLDWLPATGP